MQIKMQFGPAPNSLTYSRWKTGIIGDVLDEREIRAIKFIKENCDTVYTFRYDLSSLKIKLINFQ